MQKIDRIVGEILDQLDRLFGSHGAQARRPAVVLVPVLVDPRRPTRRR